MRKGFLANNLKFVSFLLLLSTSLLKSAVCPGPPVVWTGTVFSDETDTNIVLDSPAPITIMDGIRVTADTCDVCITMTTGDVIIQGQAAGNSRLYLNATGGRTITFKMTNNLTFRGSAAGAPLDLLVIVQGLGDVIFQIDGGKKLTLTRNGAMGGRVQMYLEMDTPSMLDETPTLIFERAPTDPAPGMNIEVAVQLGSILSYLAEVTQPNSDEEGSIHFDGTNAAGTGRTILTIGNSPAAVIVRGRKLDPAAPSKFTLADIDPSIPTGLEAAFVIENNNAATAGSLLIQNFNDVLGEFIWDPFCDLGVRDNPPFGNFSGVQWGFIIGSFGVLEVETNAYLDYVGLTGTVCPDPAIPGVDPKLVATMVKPRSPSALFTDGQPDPTFTPPRIEIDETAAVFFRSGVDNFGNIRPITDPNPFTIDPNNRTPGAGFPVFDIEGPLDIIGANLPGVQRSKFELLSLEVAPTGGPLFVGGNETIFPLRTFVKVPAVDPCTGIDKSTFLSYNNASFLNNGRADLFDVSFNHTDENHHVFEKNDVTSEPAYIGGETWKLKPCIPKPKWAFINSRFNVHTSVALTGVELLVPNGFEVDGNPVLCTNNDSQFFFYQNGKKIDDANGRQMILGTFVGSTACDGCTVICKDSQLDVMQTSTCDNGQGLLHILRLKTAPNDDTIVEGITGDISNQFSIQTIFLGNNSNISVGTNGSEGTSMDVTITEQFNFPLTTDPQLVIEGNFYSFETRGGSNNLPCTSNVTGQGGIFVDMNGTFSIGDATCGYRANMGAMVTLSRNGVVDLPKNRVFFDATIGIANWNLDLNDPNQRVIIPADRCLSDYTLNWMFVTKDFDVFCPYIIDCFDPCDCEPVEQKNVDALPTVEGVVQQFQIKGSRLGDPAHLKVKGGCIGELVMLTGFNSAEAPVAVIVLEDNFVNGNRGHPKVGLGSAHRNVDSLKASIQLGVNGVNIILNGGEGQINMNEDLIVNNICSILPGPEATSDAVLRFSSDCCRKLRVTKDGILDLSAFSEGQVVEFAGNVRVIFEPGATVIFGSANPKFRFVDQATCEFQPVINTSGLVDGADLTVTDTVRVKFTGVGEIEFADCSRCDLPRDAFVGIESLPECNVNTTFVTLFVTDRAQVHIGDVDCKIPGGALQVGNVESLLSPLVTFSLVLDGPDATFEVGPQGFFGPGVGIVEKGHTGHDSWRVAPTANVQKVSLNLMNGKFVHSQAYAGSDVRSALIAFSDSVDGNVLSVFDFFCDPLFGANPFDGTLLSNTTILGGGNFIAVAPIAPVFNPVVGIQNGFINVNYTAGILASKPLLILSAFQNVDAFTAQINLRVHDIVLPEPVNKRGVAASSCFRNQIRVVYVDSAGGGGDGLIGRAEIEYISGKSAQTNVQEHTLEIGVVQLDLLNSGAPPRAIVSVNEIGN